MDQPQPLVVNMAEKVEPKISDKLRNQLDFYRWYVKGTTTMGFLYNEGVMVTLDHKAKKEPGAFPNNIILLNSHLLASFSGGRKRSREYLLNWLPQKCKKHELKKGRKASAAEVLKWLARFLFRHPDSSDSFSLGILIAGWDEESGPVLYKVNGMGRWVKDSIAGTGCACFSIEDLPGYDINMPMFKAKELAKLTLCLALYRAHKRREYVSVFHVGRTGVESVVSNEDIVEVQKQDMGAAWRDMSYVNKLKAGTMRRRTFNQSGGVKQA